MSSVDELRVAFTVLARYAAPRDDCPSAAILFDAAIGSAPSERFEATVDHTLGCGACAEAWRLARDLSDETGHAGATARTGSRRFLWMGLAAAAAILAVGLPLMALRPGREALPSWRSDGPMTIQSLQPENERMARDRFLLRWSEPAPGARYSVTVGDEQLETLAVRDHLDRPEFQVPAEVLASLPSGSKILWRVQARLPDGRRVESPTFIALSP